MLFVTTLSCQTKKTTHYTVDDSLFLSYVVDLKKQNLAFYLAKEDSTNFLDFKTLKQHIEKENKTLVFATNGGMFNKQLKPQGLYVENGITITKIDTLSKGYGNFYLQPNGVFYITQNKQATICETKDYKNIKQIKYATQSGPLLIIDSKLHPAFNKGSKNINIRNGVGILPNGHLLFVMSKQKINFYDFATFFKQNGCANALYLDGFVSKTYLPNKKYNALNGEFGVIIAETKSSL